MNSPIFKEQIFTQLAHSMEQDSSPSAIKLLIQKYPEYEEEIVEMAVSILTRKYPTKDPFQSDQERAQVLKVATQIYKEVIDQSQKNSFEGIKAKLKELKIDSEKFQESTGLTNFLILNLDQKLVDVTSIPSRILKSISETLSVPTYILRNYLFGGLPSHGTANFKSLTAPTSATKKTFEEIVKEDISLSEEERLKLIR